MSAWESSSALATVSDYGTVNKLREAGIPILKHRAVQMTKSDYDRYDYLIGMDDWNIRNMSRITGGDPEGKMYKLLEFAGKSRVKELLEE